MFYAASNCCLEILLELLDNGHANVHHEDKQKNRTALSKAHNYEAVMILTKFGAESNRNPNDMKRLMTHHNSSSPKAILSQCISEVNEELLVLDFGHFKHTTEKNNEMDLHVMVQDHGKSELLLHPIFQVFLDLKWNQVKKFFWFNLLVDIIFVVLLTLSAYHFLDLIYCKPCDEIMDRSWSMKINYNNIKGTIDCFTPFGICYENEKLNSCEKRKENCSTILETCSDSEKCARFRDNRENETIEPYDAWGNFGIKCHKHFLRYRYMVKT